MELKRAAQGAGTLAGLGAGALLARGAWRSLPVGLARMSGTSITAPDAAGWVTDFLNAAYYARRPELREVDDLRLAFAILTTRWDRLGHRRLHAPDLLAFHRAFFWARLRDTADSPRGTLDRDGLLAGAGDLLGPWFEEAYLDDERRVYGIAFETAAERDGYRPQWRLRHARLGEMTPPERPRDQQVWHTYHPVAIASAQDTIAALARPETWPDYASDLGRFTPVRPGGLLGQTFEVEVISALTSRTPVILRGYVTVSTVLEREQDASALDAYAEHVGDLMVRFGRDQPPVFPPGSTPLFALSLDTHADHFMGRGRNRLVVYELDGRYYLRAAGTWDDMPITLEQAYRAAGRRAQEAFWGDERAESSMLHQVARATAPS